MEYHVAKTGSDKNDGTRERPFLTISRAAAIAEEGDVVVVHEGVYRECVSPENGARTSKGRITYEAADGERVVIKGSEIVDGWEKADGVYKAEAPNSIFDGVNPYSEIIEGDWYMTPLDHRLHTGQVYIDGEVLAEAASVEETRGRAMSWYAEVNDSTTVFYANFGDKTPDGALVEVNARRSCFCPRHTNIDNITVRGFEMAQAATQWSPPTSEQTGILSVNWSRGWIIEDNVFHDARCCAVCVGKERSTGHNLNTRYHRMPGYQVQLEAVFAARRIGWSRERIGSHIIRNNTIYDCGQTGIVGHLGGAFSEIYGNHIYNIANKHEFYGYEIAGIKLHAAIDTQIHDNRIHDCLLGTWLDWEAQGVRVSRNLYYNNETDIWIEVTHGPHTVDNNIFGSEHNFLNAAQGGAYVNNLFCGATNRYDVRDRSTPYHLPHSTEIKGCACVYGGDDRYYQNIFVGGSHDNVWKRGTVMYNGFTASEEEFIKMATEHGRGDIERYANVRQPAYIGNNLYLGGAEPFEREDGAVVDETDPQVKFIEDGGEVYVEITLPACASDVKAKMIGADDLHMTRLSEGEFENPDGTPISTGMAIFGGERSLGCAGPFESAEAGRRRIRVW